MSTFFVVTGAPCSGKSTWVANHRKGRTGVTVDLDALRVALGSQVSHGHGSSFLKFALAARTALVAEWKRSGTIAPTMYYICTSPSPEELAIFPKSAIFVHLPTSQVECRRRAVADKRPHGTLRLIDRYFGSHR